MTCGSLTEARKLAQMVGRIVHEVNLSCHLRQEVKGTVLVPVARTGSGSEPATVGTHQKSRDLITNSAEVEARSADASTTSFGLAPAV